MPLTITYVRDGETVAGNRRSRLADVAFDNNYTTGGLALTARQMGLRQILTMTISGPNMTNEFTYNIATGRLQAYVPAGTEVTGGTNLSAVTGVRLMAIGY